MQQSKSNAPVIQERWRGLKRVSATNWLSPDPTSRFISHVSHSTSEIAALLDVGNYFAERFTSLELADIVSDEVARFFNVAKGAVVYAVFFYPLLDIGLERAFTAVEVATAECSRSHSAPATIRRGNHKNRISWLCENGWISAELCTRVHLTRKRRNIAKHQSQSILMPIDVVKALRWAKDDIERLAESRDCSAPAHVKTALHDHLAGFPED